MSPPRGASGAPGAPGAAKAGGDRDRLPSRRGLFARIYLHFLVLLVVVGLATGTVFATGWRSAWARHATERLARHAAKMVAERWNDPAARDRQLRQISDTLDVDLTVRGTDGAVLTTTGPVLPALSPRERQEVRGGPTFIGGQRRGWFVAVPVIDRRSGAELGVLQAAIQRRWPPPPLWRPVLAVLLVLVVVAAGTMPLARRISRPVERLIAATRRFGRGELGARVTDCPHPRRGDELAELTRAWNEMADRIERLVGGHKELLANVSHELRSPLARLRLALELLPRPDGDTERRLGEIEGDLGELERLIDDLLTNSRLEAAALKLRPAKVEVDTLLGGLVERAHRDPLLAEREVRIAAQAARAVVVEADGELLRRALWNLVENAAKYGAPPITLDAQVTGGGPAGAPRRLVLTVHDEGPGIPPAEREQVFTAFYRGDRARTPSPTAARSQGFGLGLTLARRIAEVHGGTLTVVDNTGGCTLALTLPLDAKH